jgi:hypothetical protein
MLALGFPTSSIEDYTFDALLPRNNRYLMSRLSLQVPVTSCIVDSAAIYIMVFKMRNTICPPPPQLSLHKIAALTSNSNGTRSVYNRKNPKSSLYRVLWDVYAGTGTHWSSSASSMISFFREFFHPGSRILRP